MPLNFNQKYISKNLNELVFDYKFIEFIKLMIDSNCLNLLLIGGHASGKSILIKTIIKEYLKDISSSKKNNSIMYLNNIKDRGIQYYRNEVKLFCQFQSEIKKPKLLIIDDLDQIDPSYQQIIQNYIDKWGHNFNLLASTNNIYKIDDNIQSRLFIINIPKKSNEKIQQLALKIIHEEHIQVHPSVISYLLEISDGSIQIILNLFLKYKLLNKYISLELAQQLCTIISYQDFNKYTHFCKNNNKNEALKCINEFVEKGYSIIDILDDYLIFIKNNKDLDEDTKYKIINLISKYVIVFYTIHEEEIELVLFTNNLIEIF